MDTDRKLYPEEGEFLIRIIRLNGSGEDLERELKKSGDEINWRKSYLAGNICSFFVCIRDEKTELDLYFLKGRRRFNMGSELFKRELGINLVNMFLSGYTISTDPESPYGKLLGFKNDK